MPLYEYECRKCGSQFEKLVLSRSAKIVCTKCHSSDLSQLISVFAVAGGGAEKASSESGPCGACGAPERGSCQSN